MRVYAIYNKLHGKIYVGQTENFEGRLAEHNSKNNQYIGRFYGQWESIYQEKCKDRSTAIAREKQLKPSRGRVFIKSLINNPG